MRTQRWTLRDCDSGDNVRGHAKEENRKVQEKGTRAILYKGGVAAPN